MSIFDKFLASGDLDHIPSYQDLFEGPDEDIGDTLGFTKVYKGESQTRFTPLNYSTPLDIYILGLTVWSQAYVNFLRNLGAK